MIACPHPGCFFEAELEPAGFAMVCDFDGSLGRESLVLIRCPEGHRYGPVLEDDWVPDPSLFDLNFVETSGETT